MKGGQAWALARVIFSRQDIVLVAVAHIAARIVVAHHEEAVAHGGNADAQSFRASPDDLAEVAAVSVGPARRLSAVPLVVLGPGAPVLDHLLAGDLHAAAALREQILAVRQTLLSRSWA